MMDQLPPHSVDAEQAVLGAIMFSPAAIAKVADILTPADMYRSAHQYIYTACLDLFRLGEPTEPVNIIERLNDTGYLEAAGGRPYLMDLAMSCALADNIRSHAEIVKGHALRRGLQSLGWELAARAQTENGMEVMEFLQAQMLELARSNDRQKDPSATELAKQALKQIEQKLHHPNRVTGIPTGFPQLDKLIGGLRGSKLIILGARPGMGKSGFSLNIATNVVVQQKRPVLFYSLEMEPVDMMERVLMSLAESNSHLDRLQQAAAQVPDILKIIDRPNLNVTQLRASIIKNKLEMKDLGLVVIDYLQLMKSSGGNRNEEISALTRELKLISREFKIPVLCLSQLSREVEKRQDKRPMKSDLRDSGSIEQDADIILLIYRDDYYNKDSEKPNMAEIIVDKNRDGREGSFDLAFRSSVIKFIDLELRD